jgi:hypothetical protein
MGNSDMCEGVHRVHLDLYLRELELETVEGIYPGDYLYIDFRFNLAFKSD